MAVTRKMGADSLTARSVIDTVPNVARYTFGGQGSKNSRDKSATVASRTGAFPGSSL